MSKKAGTLQAHFISTDPFKVQDDPQSANPYGYAAGNPITFQDPNGLWPSLSKAWNSTTSWVSSHKDTIATVAVTGAGYGVRVAESKETFSAGGLLKAAAQGAIGYAGGKAASFGVKALAKTGAGKATGKALSTAARSVKSKAAGAVKKALGVTETKGENLVASCVRRSFAPATKVLMGDGSTKAIADVRVGDRAQSTDPATGVSGPQAVTTLHLNDDTDLVDVAVHDEGTNAESTLQATSHHPFFDASTHSWVNAVAIVPGHLLWTEGKARATVAAVILRSGDAVRRDVTVANTHTYHVLAGLQPVLVHNCNIGHLNLPRTGGVYIVHMTDGKVYVGIPKNMHQCLHEHRSPSKGAKSAITKAGYTVDDIVRVHAIPVKPYSKVLARKMEKKLIKGAGGPQNNSNSNRKNSKAINRGG